jgi:hypothetical protein
VSRTPNLFIVGAPKSGTTSLYEYLKGHPQVFMSAVKEPCYFATDLAFDRSGNFLVYERDAALYQELFADAGDAQLVGEGSTRYLYSHSAPALIHRASPDARIIAMLRNPVDMIQSLHAHKLAGGTEDLASLEEALDAEADRAAGRRLPEFSNPKLATYRDRARYGEQLPRWFDEFGRDRVRVIIFEDMVRDTPGEFRALLEFLGVDPTYAPESFMAHNAAHGTRSPLVRRLVRGRVAQWLAWGVLPRIIGATRTRSMAQRFGHSRMNRRTVPRGKLTPELRRRLEDDFTPDVARLSSLLGRDMSQLWFGRPVSGSAGAVPEPAAAHAVSAD